MQFQTGLESYYRLSRPNVERQRIGDLREGDGLLIYEAMRIGYKERGTENRIKGEKGCSICSRQALS
jgi:hypothetical protein